MVLLPQTARISTPRPSASRIVLMSSPVLPKPMLPDIIRYQRALMPI